MGVEETALDLIALTYDAALAPDKWRPLMDRLVKVMGARSALLRDVDYSAGQVGLFETVGYDPVFVDAYRRHFVHLDYFADPITRMPVGKVMRGDEAVPWEQQRNTEFYNDYLRAQGQRHVFGSIIARDDNYQLLFAMQREAGQPDFSDEDIRLIEMVAPHMARAVHIYRQITDASSHRQWALSTLDRLRTGVILLDERGRPLFLNREAERLVRTGTGLVAKQDGLKVTSPADTEQLRRLIDEAAKAAVGRSLSAGGCLRVRMGAAGESTLQFHVIPLPQDISERQWGQTQCRGCVAVFVSRPTGPRLPWSRLAAMHGLTRAEARLAALLAEGMSPEEAADALAVSTGTVRSQMKAVFAKTGVARQAELVALLLADMLTDHQADDAD